MLWGLFMGIDKFRKHPILSKCLKSELKGIENQHIKKYIKFESGKSKQYITGSINLDSCYEKINPDGNRWDYIIFLNKKDCPPCQCIEIHPAVSKAVTLMEKKLEWVKQLITDCRGNIKKNYLFIWIATDGIHIPPGSPQYRQYKKLGIELIKEFRI